jgi:hypothetical protein
MLTHQEFGRLRLSEFVPKERIHPVTDFEFLDRLWVGETVGFSEWLRPQERPDVLESLSLDFDDLPADVVERVLAKIQLPLRKGMELDEIVSLLGARYQTYTFVDDRKEFEFRFGNPDAYDVSCVVRNDGGLIYVVVTAA